MQIVKSFDSVTLLYYTAPFNFTLFILYSTFYEDLFNIWHNADALHNKVYLFFTLQMTASTYWYFCMTGIIASFFNIFAYLQVELVGAYISLIVSQLKAPVTIVVSY